MIDIKNALCAIARMENAYIKDWLDYHLQLGFNQVFLYATSLYRERHPDVIARIENSVNNPFMSDDLPHLMLDLAGINTPLFNPLKSPINPLLDKARKRLIGNDVKYDYDEICGKK